jgi:hypothetical protein
LPIRSCSIYHWVAVFQQPACINSLQSMLRCTDSLCVFLCLLITHSWQRVHEAAGTISNTNVAVNNRESSSSAVAATNDASVREEWMIVPPTSLGVLGALKTSQPTNR